MHPVLDEPRSPAKDEGDARDALLGDRPPVWPPGRLRIAVRRDRDWRRNDDEMDHAADFDTVLIASFEPEPATDDEPDPADDQAEIERRLWFG